MLALLGLVIVLFAGLGWYLGWYHVAVSPTADGHKKIEFDVDSSKLKDDVSTGIEKGKEFVDTFRKKDADPDAPKELVGPPKPANLTPVVPNTGTPGPVTFK
jgi:hypothetical protein